MHEPLPQMTGGFSAQCIMARHNSEVWSQRCRERPECSTLRIPLPASERQWETPLARMPARPEFYDFSLAEQAADLGEVAGRALLDQSFVAFDTETTGLRPSDGDEIIWIAAVRIVNGRILRGEVFDQLVDPQCSIPRSSTRFHGVRDEDVRDQPTIDQVLPRFKAFVGDDVLVAHNAAFDMRFIRMKEDQCATCFNNPVLDTLLLSVFLHDHTAEHTLEAIAWRLGTEISGRHTALGDAMVTAVILTRMIPLLRERGITTVGEAIDAANRMTAVRQQQAVF